MADFTSSPCKVLVNGEGRYALWPGRKAVPIGWTEALAAHSRSKCLEFVGRAYSRLRSQARKQHRTMDFSLLFFGGDEGQNAREKYEFVIAAAQFADAHGFAAVWLPERHFTRMGSLYPNPAVLHAALARETRNIRLRAGSVVLPLHNPIRVAEEWALVDNLSGGRVELSFAPGWNTEDFALRPEYYNQRYDVMYDGVRTVERLWNGESIEASDGTGQPIRVRTYPTPVQKQLVKWITAAGSLQSFQEAGRIGAHLLTHLFDQSVEELAEKIAQYRRARAENGHDPAAGWVCVTLHTFLAESDAEVRSQAFRPYCDYLKANLKLIEKLAQGRNIPVDVSRLSPAELDAALEWLFDKFLQQRSLLGTPQSCSELVTRLLDSGVQEIACLVDFGPSSQAILDSLPKLDELRKRFSHQAFSDVSEKR